MLFWNAATTYAVFSLMTGLLFNRKLKVLVTKRFYMILPANTLFIFGREFIRTCSLKKKSHLLKIDYLYKIRYVAEQF